MIEEAGYYTWKGAEALHRDNYEQAISRYTQALEFAPDNQEALVGLGWALLAMEQFQRASESFFQAVEQEPNDYAAYLGLGRSLRKLGCYEEALQEYHAASRLAPYDPYPHIGIASVYRERREFRKASEALAVARDLAPDNADIDLEAGELAMRAKDYPAVLRLCQRASESGQESLNALYLRGWALAKQKQYSSARDIFREIIAQKPHWFGFWYSLGWVEWRLGHFDSAITAMKTAIDINPHHTDSSIGLGIIQFHMGQWRDGWRTLRMVVRRLKEKEAGEKRTERRVTSLSRRQGRNA